LDSEQCRISTNSLLLLPRDWYVRKPNNFVFVIYSSIANRSLEDLDAYYRSDPSLIVTGDPDAICRKRPLKYIQREDEEFERTAVAKSVVPVGEHVEWTEAK
jgi:hypothetical protein